MKDKIKIVEGDPPKLPDIINNRGGLLGNKLFKLLFEREKVRVLDLGCRFPLYLINAYHELNTTFLQGVDIAKDETECLNDLKKFAIKSFDVKQEEFKDLNESKNFFEYYPKSITPDNNSFRKNQMTESEFKSVILDNLLFNTRLEDYVISTEEKFDLIICHNVLHFTNQNEMLISKIGSLLKSDGFIYIRVENQSKLYNPEKRTYYNKVKFIQELNQTFNKGFIYQSDKNDDWHSLVFINLEL